MIAYFISFDNIFVREFGCRDALQRFYPRVPLFLGIFHIKCMEVGWVFVEQLIHSETISWVLLSTPFKAGQKNLVPLPFWMRGTESSDV